MEAGQGQRGQGASQAVRVDTAPVQSGVGRAVAAAVFGFQRELGQVVHRVRGAHQGFADLEEGISVCGQAGVDLCAESGQLRQWLDGGGLVRHTHW